MSELLRKHFSKYVSLTEKEFETALSFFEHKQYKKHQYILQEGDVSRYESFIIKGCTKTFEVDEKGQEHIVQLSVEDWWIGDMYSFLTLEPSKANISCIEDTEILRISVDRHDKLLQAVPKLERHFRKLVENAYSASLKRVYANMSRSAQERYVDFIERYPHLEQRIPNHYIASYLGITPQSLSRIRKQMSLQKPSAR